VRLNQVSSEWQRRWGGKYAELNKDERHSILSVPVEAHAAMPEPAKDSSEVRPDLWLREVEWKVADEDILPGPGWKASHGWDDILASVCGHGNSLASGLETMRGQTVRAMNWAYGQSGALVVIISHGQRGWRRDGRHVASSARSIGEDWTR
jgi:hypothetical protein